MDNMKRAYTKDARKRVLCALSLRNWMSPAQVAENTGLTRQQVSSQLHLLKRDHLVEFKGRTTSIKYRRARNEKVVQVNIDLECPNELQVYFKWPTTFMTANEFSVIASVPIVTAYRYLKKWEVEGLVEMHKEGRLNKEGKRVRLYRRLYNAVTFNSKGEVVVQSVDLDRPF